MAVSPSQEHTAYLNYTNKYRYQTFAIRFLLNQKRDKIITVVLFKITIYYYMECPF